jgi:competence protein ComEC
MNIFATISVTWLVSLAVGALVTPGVWQPMAALSALLFGVLVTAAASASKRFPSVWGSLALFALAILGALLAGLSTGSVAKDELPAPPAGLARVEAVVEQVHVGPDVRRANSVIRIISGERIEDKRPFPVGIRLAVWPTPLPERARIKLLVQVKPWTALRNPSPHPPLPRTASIQGRGWIVSPSAVKLLGGTSFWRWISGIRQIVRQRIDQTLPTEVSGLARALLIGDANAVAKADSEAVRAAGLAHVLAVSGMHVTILVGLLVIILARMLLFIPWIARRFETRRIAYAMGIPLSLAYAAFAGSSPSAWRAAVTASIGWTLVAWGMRPIAAATSAAAAVLLGAIEPRFAIDPSFMLSIVATAAVISSPKVDGDGLTRWLKAAFSITLRASVATAPIILWCFGSLPMVGLAANLVLVPIGELVMIPLVALHALVALISQEAARLTGIPFTTTANAFVKACELFAATPFKLPLPPPDIPQGITLALLSFTLLMLRRWRARVVVLAFALLPWTAFEIRLRTVEKPIGCMRVTFLDVGEGDSALVDLPNGQLMLVDAGGDAPGGLDTGKAVILPLLRARRRDRIDIAVLTHPHPDHYGGLKSVLQELPVTELWDTGQAHAERDWDKSKEMRVADELLAFAKERGVKVRGPAQLCKHPRRVGDARIELLWPCPAYDARYHANDNSMVIRLDYQNRSFLFTGDIETEAEAILLSRKANVRADVLKVAHHGSATSSTELFLAAVHPKLAVVSAGAFNRYGHPDAQVLNRINHLGTKIKRLDRGGGITVSIENGKLLYE